MPGCDTFTLRFAINRRLRTYPHLFYQSLRDHEVVRTPLHVQWEPEVLWRTRVQLRKRRETLFTKPGSPARLELEALQVRRCECPQRHVLARPDP